MGVQLNIKTEATVRLARELAEASGTSMTQAVHSALELAAAKREAAIASKVEQMNALVAEFQLAMPADWKGKTSKEIMDAIYDDGQPDGFAL